MKYVRSLICILSLVVLAACSEPDQDNRHLHFVYNFSTQSLDPHRDSSYVPLRAGVTETLFKLNDETLSVDPWLARSFEQVNETTWRIYIREDVTFHNGKPLDAQAVKRSLDRSLDENIGLQSALRIKSITAEASNLLIETTIPYPELVNELVHPNTSIIDVTADAAIDQQPIGTGPFQVVSFQPGSNIQLERHNAYWDGTPKLDTVMFTFNEDPGSRTMALQSGEADIVYRPEIEMIDTLEQNGHIVDKAETFRVHQLTMNLERGHMQSLAMRRMIDSLINREQIVDGILNGYATTAAGPFLPSFPFAPTYENHEEQDVLYLLKQDGYENVHGVLTKDGEPVRLKLLTYSSRPDLPLIAQLIQSDAKQAGITIDIQMIDTPEEYMASERNWDLATYSNLTAPRGDGGYYLNATFHPDGALNFSGVEDSTLTQKIDRLNETVDRTERDRMTEEIAQYVDERVINSFLVHPSTNVALKDSVRGWVTEKSEYYMITKDLDVL
ncbi:MULTISPECIES: nickel ABC transporter substrate-binding protein [Exiguobacterium]|uniref:nickel ABC transporter substrate-binding protein n=1 Tax=Exiguobacterium TaxID=33986 RepID=UPI001BE98C5F|nr:MULTISPECIES: nickel ABC transporter substrate-binding protein [Exiguobacterium]MCT4783277.1 ABC transporter substrate-binding protein [Exiguobacterium himgiriensis]